MRGRERLIGGGDFVVGLASQDCCFPRFFGGRCGWLLCFVALVIGKSWTLTFFRFFF